MTYKEIFKGECPYTGRNCEDWNCLDCKINKEEEKCLKEYLEYCNKLQSYDVKLICNKGNCFFYFEKEFFFSLTITKFKKLLKCLDFNESNFKNLNIILNFEEKYKNKSRFNYLIIDYLIKNYNEQSVVQIKENEISLRVLRKKYYIIEGYKNGYKH